MERFGAFTDLTPIPIIKTLIFWLLVGINNSNPIDAFFFPFADLPPNVDNILIHYSNTKPVLVAARSKT